MSVTRDPFSQRYVPATAAEWTELLSGSGLANPSSLWLCQEPSSTLADTIGGFALSPDTVTYQNAVTGWSRKAVGIADGGAAMSFHSTSIVNLATTSYLLLGYVALTNAAPAAQRGVMGFGNGADYRYAALTTGGKYRAQIIAGAGVDGVSLPGTSVHLVAVQVDRAASAFRVYIDLTEVIVGSWVNPTAGGALLAIGDEAATSAGANYLYAAGFTGTAAQLSVLQVQNIISRLLTGPTLARGPSVATTIAISPDDGASVDYEWKTDILGPTLSGLETRIALRGAPRERYHFAANLSDATLMQIQAAIVRDGALGTAFAIGVQPESLAAGDAYIRSWTTSPSIDVPSSAFADWNYQGARAAVLSSDESKQWNGVVQNCFTDMSYPYSIFKTGGTNGFWDTISYAWEVSRTDCAVEALAQPNGTGNIAMSFGLSILDQPTTADVDVQRMIFLDGAGPPLSYRVVESAVVVATGNYVVGDVFRIARIGTQVKYFKNGTVIFTSGTATNNVQMRPCARMAYSWPLNPNCRMDGFRFFDNGVPVHLTWRNNNGQSVVATGGVFTGTPPASAADMSSACRWGTWTNGWRFNQTNLTGGSTIPAMFGGQNLTVSGTPIVRTGPLGAGDVSLQVPSPSYTIFSAANNTVLDIGTTQDLMFAAMMKVPMLKTTTAEFARCAVKAQFVGGTPYYQFGASTGFGATTAMFLEVNDGAGGHDLFANCKHFAGQWIIVCVVLDRVRQVMRIGTINVETGEISLSSETSISALGSLTNTGTFAVNNYHDSAIDLPWLTNHTLFASSGVGVAAGVSESMAAVLQNLSDTYFPRRIAIDSLAGNVPKTAAQVRDAFGGRGVWTHGWQFNETTTTTAKGAFGGVDLIVSPGAAFGGAAGPFGAGDYALEFPSTTGNWNDNDNNRFDVAANEDLAVAVLVRFTAIPSAFYGNIVNKVTSAFTLGWSLTGRQGDGYAFGLGPGGGGSGVTFMSAAQATDGYHLGEWHLVIGSMDRASGKVGLISYSLASGRYVLAALGTMSAVAVTANTVPLTIGASAWVSANTPMRIAACFIAKGVGSATGLTTNLVAAAQAFHRYVLPTNGARIMPAVPSYLGESQGIDVYANNAGKLQLEAQSAYFGDSNGAWTPKPALHIVEYVPFNDPTNYPVWTPRVVVEGASRRALLPGVELLDRGGALQVVGDRYFGEVKREMIVRVNTDAERQYLKQFMGRVVGQQKAWLLPTWKPDLIPVTGDASTSVLLIKSQTDGGVDYASKWLANDATHVLMFQCADGTIKYRTVSDATDNLNGTQTLQLDVAVTGTTITTISFMEKCRFDSDVFSFGFANARGSVRVPIRVVQQ